MRTIALRSKNRSKPLVIQHVFSLVGWASRNGASTWGPNECLTAIFIFGRACVCVVAGSEVARSLIGAASLSPFSRLGAGDPVTRPSLSCQVASLSCQVVPSTSLDVQVRTSIPFKNTPPPCSSAASSSASTTCFTNWLPRYHGTRIYHPRPSESSRLAQS